MIENSSPRPALVEHPQVVEVDVGAHPLPVLLGRRFRGAEDAGDVRAVVVRGRPVEARPRAGCGSSGSSCTQSSAFPDRSRSRISLNRRSASSRSTPWSSADGPVLGWLSSVISFRRRVKSYDALTRLSPGAIASPGLYLVAPVLSRNAR